MITHTVVEKVEHQSEDQVLAHLGASQLLDLRHVTRRRLLISLLSEDAMVEPSNN
jgi:hypothetical protein